MGLCCRLYLHSQWQIMVLTKSSLHLISFDNTLQSFAMFLLWITIPVHVFTPTLIKVSFNPFPMRAHVPFPSLVKVVVRRLILLHTEKKNLTYILACLFSSKCICILYNKRNYHTQKFRTALCLQHVNLKYIHQQNIAHDRKCVQYYSIRRAVIVIKLTLHSIKDTSYAWGPKMTPLLCFIRYFH